MVSKLISLLSAQAFFLLTPRWLGGKVYGQKKKWCEEARLGPLILPIFTWFWQFSGNSGGFAWLFRGWQGQK
jgi:hypothetical protein